jgi:triosephosphate isomerase
VVIMKKKLIAGNWKMNGSLAANEALVQGLCGAWGNAACDVAVACRPVSGAGAGLLAGLPAWRWVRRMSRPLRSGAYTGETSAAMLKEFGVRYAWWGTRSAASTMAKPMRGGRKGQRRWRRASRPSSVWARRWPSARPGKTEAVVKRQLAAVIHLNGHCISEIVVAYEPVWAIGTGARRRLSRRSKCMPCCVRSWQAATNTRIAFACYGGSMNAANAAQLLAQPDIDGGLVGGASLEGGRFFAIIAAAQ